MENQSFLSDAEWKGHLSSAYGELYSEIVATGLRHFEEEDTITTDGGSSYPLPRNFLSTIGVDYQVTTAGQRAEIPELMAQERNMFAGVTGASSARGYSLVGAGPRPLELYPAPPTGQTYYHLYVPQPRDLVDMADNTDIDVVTPDGEEFLLWSVAAIALAKEQSDNSVQKEERERTRARVVEWATLRALNQPRRRVVAEELWAYQDGDWWRRYY
jgi:hypothetical protein